MQTPTTRLKCLDVTPKPWKEAVFEISENLGEKTKDFLFIRIEDTTVRDYLKEQFNRDFNPEEYESMATVNKDLAARIIEVFYQKWPTLKEPYSNMESEIL